MIVMIPMILMIPMIMMMLYPKPPAGTLVMKMMKTCSSCAKSSDKGADDDAKRKHQVQVAKRDQI